MVNIGINNVSKRSKELYIGVKDTAKRVKRAYIGVNGKAKLCCDLDLPLPVKINDIPRTVKVETGYYLEDATLSSTKDYAIILGGRHLEVYVSDFSCIRIINKDFTVIRKDYNDTVVAACGAHNKEYAMFAGGIPRYGNGNEDSNISAFDNVIAYDNSLTKKNCARIGYFYDLKSTETEDGMFFGGGKYLFNSSGYTNNKLYKYNRDLTKENDITVCAKGKSEILNIEKIKGHIIMTNYNGEVFSVDDDGTANMLSYRFDVVPKYSAKVNDKYALFPTYTSSKVGSNNYTYAFYVNPIDRNLTKLTPVSLAPNDSYGYFVESYGRLGNAGIFVHSNGSISIIDKDLTVTYKGTKLSSKSIIDCTDFDNKLFMLSSTVGSDLCTESLVVDLNY